MPLRQIFSPITNSLGRKLFNFTRNISKNGSGIRSFETSQDAVQRKLVAYHFNRIYAGHHCLNGLRHSMGLLWRWGPITKSDERWGTFAYSNAELPLSGRCCPPKGTHGWGSQPEPTVLTAESSTSTSAVDASTSTTEPVPFLIHREQATEQGKRRSGKRRPPPSKPSQSLKPESIMGEPSNASN